MTFDFRVSNCQEHHHLAHLNTIRESLWCDTENLEIAKGMGSDIPTPYSGSGGDCWAKRMMVYGGGQHNAQTSSPSTVKDSKRSINHPPLDSTLVENKARVYFFSDHTIFVHLSTAFSSGWGDTVTPCNAPSGFHFILFFPRDIKSVIKIRRS